MKSPAGALAISYACQMLWRGSYYPSNNPMDFLATNVTKKLDHNNTYHLHFKLRCKSPNFKIVSLLFKLIQRRSYQTHPLPPTSAPKRGWHGIRPSLIYDIGLARHQKSVFTFFIIFLHPILEYLIHILFCKIRFLKGVTVYRDDHVMISVLVLHGVW